MANWNKLSKKDIMDLVNYINGYDTHYGDVKVIELPNSFIIQVYNGGWSDNEEKDRRFRQTRAGKNWIFYNRHPCTLIEIFKLFIEHENPHALLS